jgi:hypothetical protein
MYPQHVDERWGHLDEGSEGFIEVVRQTLTYLAPARLPAASRGGKAGLVDHQRVGDTAGLSGLRFSGRRRRLRRARASFGFRESRAAGFRHLGPGRTRCSGLRAAETGAVAGAGGWRPHSAVVRRRAFLPRQRACEFRPDCAAATPLQMCERKFTLSTDPCPRCFYRLVLSCRNSRFHLESSD